MTATEIQAENITFIAENITFIANASDIVVDVFVDVEDTWEKIESGGPWTFGDAEYTLIRLDAFLGFLLTLATTKYERRALAQYTKHLKQLPAFVNLEHYHHNLRG